jgi:hypothetical protein
MYPSGQLAQLATRKAMLQARIAVRRWECAAAAVQLARPVALLDRGIEMWRRVSPIVKILIVPAGLFLAQLFKRRSPATAAKKSGKMAAVMAAWPLVMQGWKMVQELRATRQGRPSAATANSR